MVSSLSFVPESAFASAMPVYQPHGKSDPQRLFHERCAAFGRFRLPLISGAVVVFDACGDWENGIARIHCSDCSYDYFRPFSCKSFFLCPSCGQKRTLLLGEYLAEDLLLRLPHRQFVWTIPKALRGFLRRNAFLDELESLRPSGSMPPGSPTGTRSSWKGASTATTVSFSSRSGLATASRSSGGAP
jgi:hypothetical protein